MKTNFLVIFLVLFSIGSPFAAGEEDIDSKRLFLSEIDLKLLLDGENFTCIRPYYRRNFPLIRLGGVRVMDGCPSGPFEVRFMVSGDGRIREGSLQEVEDRVVAEIEGVVKAVKVHEDILTEKQMVDLFMEIENLWIYEKPVEDYFPVDSGMLMNLKPEFNLSREEEAAKMKRMEELSARLEGMIAEQNLKNKKAIELLDKEWYEAPSGFGERTKEGQRKMVLIVSQYEKKMVVDEVLFVVESPSTHYAETVSWCARSSVMNRFLKISREVQDYKAVP